MKYLKLAILCGIPFVLGSCVGGGGAVTTQSAPQVVTTFKTLITQLPRGNNAGTLPGDLAGGGVTTSAIESKDISRLSCDSVNPASPVDADTDGIALLKEYSFDCTDSISSTNEYTRKGSFKVIDNDDTIPGIKGGYKLEFDIDTWLVKDLTLNLTAGGSYKGFWETTGTDTTSNYKSDYSGTYYGEFDLSSHGLGQVSVDYAFSHVSDVSFTHDTVTPGAQWNTGTMEGTGSYSFSGTFLSESHSSHSVETGSATMTWKAESVTFDTTCSKWYKSGAFYLTDVAGNVIKTEFNCSEVKVYLNGTELEDYTW